jgi:hypothetical protein
MDPERAERLAAKRNARLRERFPLFADQLPPYTTESVVREFEGYARRMQEAIARLRSRAEEYKAQVRALVTPKQLAALEERRTVLPASPEYDADFWHRQLMALTERQGSADQLPDARGRAAAPFSPV